MCILRLVFLETVGFERDHVKKYLPYTGTYTHVHTHTESALLMNYRSGK